MTQTTGPVQLTVVTNYCRTREQQCCHYRKMARDGDSCHHGENGESGGRLIYSIAGEYRVLMPKWCPLSQAPIAERR